MSNKNLAETIEENILQFDISDTGTTNQREATEMSDNEAKKPKRVGLRFKYKKD